MAGKQMMENAAFSKLKADLRQNRVENLYVFCGEETYLRDHYLQQMKKKLIAGPAEAFNFHRFEGRGLSANTLSDALEALPMMAEHTLTIVDDYDLFSLGESERTRLIAALSDLPETTTVVFVYDTLTYKPDGRQKKLAALMKEKAQVVTFEKQSQRALSDWIGKHFQAHGKQISPEVCAELIFQTGGSMTTLAMEIDKLAAYTDAPVIRREDLEAVVEPVLEAVVFQITDAIRERNFDLALRKLQDQFLMQQEPISILAAIGSQLRRLYAAKVLQEQGKTIQTMMELFGMKEYPARNTMAAAKGFSMHWCEKAVIWCAETDYRLKTSYDDPQRLVEQLILRLAEEQRHG
jgi:DNA polymerase-3 subunit delta